MYTYDRRASSDSQIEKMLEDLKAKGKIQVTDGSKTFYILCKSWNGGFPYGYAPSNDGRRPATPYRQLSDDQAWNWLSKLDPA